MTKRSAISLSLSLFGHCTSVHCARRGASSFPLSLARTVLWLLRGPRLSRGTVSCVRQEDGCCELWRVQQAPTRPRGRGKVSREKLCIGTQFGNLYTVFRTWGHILNTSTHSQHMHLSRLQVREMNVGNPGRWEVVYDIDTANLDSSTISTYQAHYSLLN